MKKVIKKFGSYDHKGTYEEQSLWDCIGIILGYFAVLFVVLSIVFAVLFVVFGLFFLTLIGLSKFLLWLM